MLLPFGYDAQGNIEPAIPSLARDVGLGAFGLLGEYEKAQDGTGYQDVRDITPQEAANSMQGLLEVMTGGLIDNAPKSVRSGLSRSGDRGLLTNDLDDLGFYSPTERLAANLQPKGTGQQYLGILSKGDGQGSRIQEEMADMGLDTWLQSKGKVSRDEVLDYIGDNRLRYGKKVGRNQWSQSDEDILAELEDRASRKVRTPPDTDFNPQYQQYSQEGGTNYQEGLLTVPTKYEKLSEERNLLSRRKLGDDLGDGSGRTVSSRIDEIDEEIQSRIENSYQSTHYDQANIGLTTRTQSFNTPDGNSVHLMDELQSDWHKEGKKKGYRIPRDKKTFDALTQEKADRIVVRPTSDGQFQGFWTRPEDDWLTTGIRGSTEEEALLNTLGDTHDIRYKNATGVPNAPAKQSWINQGIKHEINQTIADGKDYFAWTGGDIQADRYSLRKQVEDIDYDIYDNTLSAYAPDGSTSIMETVELKDLDNFIGKEAADKIRTKIGYSDEQSMRSYYKQKAIEGGMAEPSADALSKTYTQVQIKNRLMDMDNAEGLVRLTGEELEVGGEGMKSFYDKDVKKRTEKIIKRLDPNAKVEVIELDNGNKVWGVKITDKMRDKVKGEGMPLYSIAPIAGAGLLGAGMMRQEDQQPQQGILN